MSIKVYSSNGKVLVNKSNGKWLYENPLPEITIGTTVWLAKDLDIDDGGSGIYHRDNKVYYTKDAAQRIVNSLTGWALPNDSQMQLTSENAAKLKLSTVDGRYLASQSRYTGLGEVTTYGTSSTMSSMYFGINYSAGYSSSPTMCESTEACIFRLIKVA